MTNAAAGHQGALEIYNLNVQALPQRIIQFSGASAWLMETTEDRWLEIWLYIFAFIKPNGKIHSSTLTQLLIAMLWVSPCTYWSVYKLLQLKWKCEIIASGWIKDFAPVPHDSDHLIVYRAFSFLQSFFPAIPSSLFSLHYHVLLKFCMNNSSVSTQMWPCCKIQNNIIKLLLH